MSQIRLTPRELEVLALLAQGQTNKEISCHLGIAVRTTNHHVENIYVKLGVNTRAGAAMVAFRNQLVA